MIAQTIILAPAKLMEGVNFFSITPWTSSSLAK